MRLTRKTKNGYCVVVNNQFKIEDKITNKLGPLEDIEDELGISLITLFKTFKNGVWARGKVKKRIIQGSYYPIGKDMEMIEYVPPQGIAWDFGRNQLVIVWDYPDGNPKLFCNLKDYGKTWALTKEELK